MNRKLIRAREEKKISQQALADAIGIHQTTLSSIERGRHRPTVEMAQKIADAIGVDVNSIFTIQTVAVVLPDPHQPEAEYA